MNIETLQTFLGWCVVIHFGMLLLVVLFLTMGRNWVVNMHQKFFDLSKEELHRSYFNYIAVYKLLVIVFVLVPYLVIRFLL
jgi:hypothetical protein